ncbi:MAG: hypothetical protein PHP28_00720 [Actinomycetota bacterium]|nr:hypothetical protein [Actinomycetota bacterium]MDD5667694.1 hypothetical protein [Actinomycetota bacterium]
MEIRRNEIVPLGYGKYYRSDKIIGLEPIGDDRGPARRTYVYVEGREEPVVASRSEEALIKDLAISQEEYEASQAVGMLERVLHEMERVGPILRRSIREETGLDMDDLILRVRRVLSREEEGDEFDQGSLFAS